MTVPAPAPATTPTAPAQTTPPTAPPATQGAPAGGQAATPAGAAAEPQKPAQAAAPQIDPKIAKAFAALQEKESRITAERRKLSSDKTALQKQLDEVKAQQALLAKAKSNPEEAMKLLGLSYDQLVDWKLSQEHPTPETRTKAEIEEAKSMAKKSAEDLESFKKAQAEKEEAQTKAQKQAAQEDLNNRRESFYNGAVAFVKQNVAEYELTNAAGAHIEVPRLIEKVYQKTAKYDDDGRMVKPGRTLSVKEAAELVEKYHLELAEKFTASEKWKKLQASKSAQAALPASKGDEKQGESAQRSTLDNSLSAATKPAGKQAPQKRETEEERVARAVAKYNEVRAKK